MLNLVRKFKSRHTNIKAGKIGLYYKGGFDIPMSKREAYLILGVSRSATGTEIKERYKHLIKINHPDSGGSNYLAIKINAAKDLIIMDAPDFKI